MGTDIMPDIALVDRVAWTSDRHHVRECFEVRGGAIADEWSKAISPPSAPWCVITIWDEGPDVVGYGGSVWPGAWPEVFAIEGPMGRQKVTLTAHGAMLFDAAREARAKAVTS